MNNYKEFTKPSLVIMVGLPGSGKSTWIIKNKPKWSNTAVVSSDLLRKEVLGDVNNQDYNSYIWQLITQITIAYLKKGTNVVLDSTNTDIEKRKEFIKEIESEVDFKKFAIVFKISPEESKRRIAKDILNKINRANVPEVVEYGYGDNNRVYVKIEGGDEVTDYVAEWCDIVTKVEDKVK
jgi:predicted kinase